jgi:hypothetical protein
MVISKSRVGLTKFLLTLKANKYKEKIKPNHSIRAKLYQSLHPAQSRKKKTKTKIAYPTSKVYSCRLSVQRTQAYLSIVWH